MGQNSSVSVSGAFSPFRVPRLRVIREIPHSALSTPEGHGAWRRDKVDNEEEGEGRDLSNNSRLSPTPNS
ncbi:hypothetical protein [uncultured Nostoc sp.]|uniref:hypothetical protein n=1 Tax=uncultured Nostoc sp. TaxID=340711 RepID=UPI0035CB6BC9